MKDYANATTANFKPETPDNFKPETPDNFKPETPDNFDYMMSGISLVLFICATLFAWLNV